MFRIAFAANACRVLRPDGTVACEGSRDACEAFLDWLEATGRQNRGQFRPSAEEFAALAAPATLPAPAAVVRRAR